MKSLDTGLYGHVQVVTETGSRRIGLISCLKRAGSSSRWPDKRRSSPTARKKPGRRQRPPTLTTSVLSINMFALNAARASMRIEGEWFRCDDGMTRPIVGALIIGPDGDSYDEAFLIDS